MNLKRMKSETGTSLIEVFAPSVEAFFEPMPVDGKPTLRAAYGEYILRQSAKRSKHWPLVVRLQTEQPAAEEAAERVTHDLRGHFRRKAHEEKETLGQTIRYGLVYLAVGLAFVLMIGFVASILRPVASSPFVRGLIESLNVFGWVALWLPAEMLLYNWIPMHRKLRLLRRLAEESYCVLGGTATRAKRPWKTVQA